MPADDVGVESMPPPHQAPQAYQAPPGYGQPPVGSPPPVMPPAYGQAPVAQAPAPGGARPDLYAQVAGGGDQPPPWAPSPRKRPSGWNLYSFILVGLALAVVVALVWPQLRARAIERDAKPLVTALSARDASVYCPRYLTAVIGFVGAVSLDEEGGPANSTQLTGPTCNALRHLYSAGGRTELACLDTAPASCSDDAVRSVVALSVVTHESMHIKGQLDEAGAECDSLGQGPVLAQTLGLRPAQGAVISWLHYSAMNPSTPPQYRVNPQACAPLQQLVPQVPTESPEMKQLVTRTAAMWSEMAS